MPHAEFAKYLLVFGEHLARRASRGGHQDDPCLAATAQLGEALKNPGAAAPVLGPADDEQATWISPVVHIQALIPDRGAAHGARSTRRYAQSIRGYFGLVVAVANSLPRMPRGGRVARDARG